MFYKKSNEFQLNATYPPTGDQPKAINSLTKGLKNGLKHQTLVGVTGSGKTYTIANVIQNIQLPTLVLAHNKTLAAQLYAEMKQFFPHNAVEYFVSYYDYYRPEAYVAASDTYIEKDSSINNNIEQMRLSATKSIIERNDVIIVATVSAIYGLGDPEQYMQMLLQLKVGASIDPHDVAKCLSNMHYFRNDIDLSRGNYRIRGQVIDIFPADSEQHIVRIELFDDEIESIKSLDYLTGNLVQDMQIITIFPSTHYVSSVKQKKNMIKRITDELHERIAYFKKKNLFIEAQRIEQRTLYDIEMIKEIGYCSGIENYSRLLSNSIPNAPPLTLLNYFPKNMLVVIDESHVTIPQFKAMYKGDRSRKENLVNYGFRLPSALDNRPLKFHEFESLITQVIYVSATPSHYEKAHNQNIVEQIIRPTGLLDPIIEIKSVKIQVEDSLSQINKAIKKNERVLITTLTKRMAEDLTDYICEYGVNIRYLHADIDAIERVEIIYELRKGVFDVLVGVNLLREGLDIPEVSTVLIFDADKEGFLRSEQALTQTIGRAARHINGKAIFYADTITTSMEKVIKKNILWRKKQQSFNIKYGIKPQSIKKKIDNLTMVDPLLCDKPLDGFSQKEIKDISSVETITCIKEANILIKKLEKNMQKYAKNLKFEQAEKIQNQIKIIKDKYL